VWGNLFEAGEQVLLGLGLLDDDLDDPVAVGQQFKMVGGITGGDEAGAFRGHESRRLRRAGLLQALSGRRRAVGRGRIVAARNIEQDHGRPAEAARAAIPLPMTPAPTTPTLVILIGLL